MFLKYFEKKDYLFFMIIFGLVVFQVWIELEIPDYMEHITKELMNPQPDINVILGFGGNMLLCALGSIAAAFVIQAFVAYLATKFTMTLRERQFDNVERFSSEEMGRFSISSLITRSTNDLTQIQMAFSMGLVVILKAPIMAIWAITKIQNKSIEWSAATGIAIVIIIILLAVTMAYVIPRFKKIQWMTDDLNRVSKEGITGVRVIRAYNAEKHQERKFDEANLKLTNTNLSTGYALSILSPFMTAIISILSLAIYWIGAYLINDAEDPMMKISEFSDMIVFSSYAMQVIMAFIALIIIFMILPRAIVAYRRIDEVINTKPSIVDGDVVGSNVKGDIVFNNVSFKYPNSSDYSIKDISFSVSKGETLAIIGATGSGKSTIVNLLPRFYDTTTGSVIIDGIDVRKYKLEDLNKKIGYVPQKAILFKGSIDSNVRYGDTSDTKTVEDVKNAIRIAQSTDFVEKMPEQYDGKISESGNNLSGGQKQRISIARAVCRRPEIYIFDDSFSALDYKTDRLLRDALKRETEGITTIIVAQRIGTIMNADKILVIEDGRIVGMGRHDYLLKNCKVYRDIALSQLSEEELVR